MKRKTLMNERKPLMNRRNPYDALRRLSLMIAKRF
jgi:hypothetical protein